jgi:hypothetical protein
MMFVRVFGKSIVSGGEVDQLVGPFADYPSATEWMEKNGFKPTDHADVYETDGNSFVNTKLGEGFKGSTLQTQLWATFVHSHTPNEVQIIVRSVA